MKLTAIILTNTSTQEVFDMTQKCIETLIKNANSSCFQLNVVLVESNKNSEFIYSDEIDLCTPSEDFNFHRFLNIGIQKYPASDWYLLCNNDLHFHENWLLEIEAILSKVPNVGSISPISPTCKDQSIYINSIKTWVKGYDRRKELSGWCLMVSQKTLNIIGLLDERFDFYFADDDYSLMLRRNNILHLLATRSFVEHLEDRKISKLLMQKNEIVNDFPIVFLFEKYKWIADSDRMMNGFLQYTKKWGDIRILAFKRRLHNLLFLRLGIKIFSKIIFNIKSQ